MRVIKLLFHPKKLLNEIEYSFLPVLLLFILSSFSLSFSSLIFLLTLNADFILSISYFFLSFIGTFTLLILLSFITKLLFNFHTGNFNHNLIFVSYPFFIKSFSILIFSLLFAFVREIFFLGWLILFSLFVESFLLKRKLMLYLFGKDNFVQTSLIYSFSILIIFSNFAFLIIEKPF